MFGRGFSSRVIPAGSERFEHDPVELLAVKRRLEELQERALAREERCVGAEQQPIRGDLSPVGRMRAVDQPANPAVALEGGDVECGPCLLDQVSEDATTAKYCVGVE